MAAVAPSARWTTEFLDDAFRAGKEAEGSGATFTFDAAPGDGKGRAGGRTRPNRAAFWPAGKFEGVRPARNSAEKMRRWGCFFRLDFTDVTFGDPPFGQKFCGNKVAEPGAGVGVVVVIKDTGSGPRGGAGLGAELGKGVSHARFGRVAFLRQS